jgi:hypothetical protein
MGMIPRREHTVFEVRPGAVLQGRSNVSFGSKTEVAALERHVRSTLHNRHRQAAPPCPFRATNGLMRCSKERPYSITWLARPSSAIG